MEFILSAYKVILFIGLFAIICSFFRSLYCVFISIKNKNTIDITQVERAEKLLIVGFIAGFVIATSIFFGEKILYGNASQYTASTILLLGCLLMIINIISSISAVAIAWRKSSSNSPYVPVLNKLSTMSFYFAVIIWASLWAIV